MGSVRTPKRDDKKVGISEISNENILINSDFKIHQRYDSNIVGMGWGIICDHWFTEFDDRTSVDSINFTNTGFQFELNKNALIVHRYSFEDYELDMLHGKEVTLSFSVNDEVLYESYIFDKNKTISIYNNNHIKEYGFVDRIGFTQSIEIGIRVIETSSVIFNWVKLEFGNKATKYENPNHTLENLKCMRYFQIAIGRTTDFAFPISQFIGDVVQWNYRSAVPMRLATPTLINTLNVQPRVLFSDKTGSIVNPFELEQVDLYTGDINKMDFTLKGKAVNFTRPEWNLGNIDATSATQGYLALDAEL